MVANFRKKNNHGTGKKVLMHLGGILALIILGVLVVANINMYQKRKEFVSQAAALQAQIKNLQKSNSNLQEGIAKENDPDYIEKVAREELDLQKPGETAISFIMPPTAQENHDGQNVLQGWLGKSWDWIKDIF